MSLPVRTVSRFLGPLIFVYALYLITTGVYSPGGAFGGGVVVGVAACLAVVAEETREVPAFDARWAYRGRTLGFLLILLTAALTLGAGGIFFQTSLLGGAGVLLRSPMIVVLALSTGIVVGGEMVIALVIMLSREEGT